MSNDKTKLQPFDSMQVQTSWDEEAEKWWFSALDIVAVLTDQADYTKNRNSNLSIAE
jgi:cell filamentation protein